MGAMSLWQVARRDVSVIGFDQYSLGHGNGSSHGGSRIFRRTVFEGEHYIPLAEKADELWWDLDRESGKPIRLATGGLSIGTAGGAFITNAKRAAQAGGVEVHELGAAELRERFPQYKVYDSDAAIFEPGACVIRPELAIQAAAEVAQNRGAYVHANEAVIGIRSVTGGVLIDTATETIQVHHAIVAAGAWMSRLLKNIDVPIRAQRTVPVWFSASPLSRETWAYGSDRFPVFVRQSAMPNGGVLDGWGIPDVDGRGVKIGIAGYPKPWLGAIEDNRTPAGSDDINPVIEFARTCFPELDRTRPAAIPCMNAKTPDNDFIIGSYPELPNITVLAGFGGHGFKHATAVGLVAAELACGDMPSIPIHAFSPTRFSASPWAGPPEPVYRPGL